MSGCLLDTNILAELRKRDRCNKNVAAWFTAQDDESIFTSVLVMGEIRRGIELARHKDSEKAKALERWLQGLTLHFESRILPVTGAIADRWGRLCFDQKLPDVDGLLAATALVHDLTLATRNTGDFLRSGVKWINPFEE